MPGPTPLEIQANNMSSFLDEVPEETQDELTLDESGESEKQVPEIDGAATMTNGTAKEHKTLHQQNALAQYSKALRQSHPHLTEAARDPRDEAPHLTPTTSRPHSPYTQFPPIDFDGLSWPSASLSQVISLFSCFLTFEN